LAVATDLKGRPGLVQLLHALGQLVVHGVAIRPEPLFRGRNLRVIDLANLPRETGPNLSPTTWIINSVRSRPLNGPEPSLLGQRRSPQAAAELAAATNGEQPRAPGATREKEKPVGSVSSPGNDERPRQRRRKKKRPAARSRRRILLRFQKLM